MGKKIGFIMDAIVDGMAAIAGLLILFMTLSICAEVILRYFFSKPLSWVTEISEYILLYVTFLGAPWVLKHDGHVRVDILLARLAPLSRSCLNILTSLVCLGTCAVLVWYGAEITLDYYHKGIPVIKSLSFPKYILLGIIPVGSFFLTVQFLRNTVGFFKETGSGNAAENPGAGR